MVCVAVLVGFTMQSSAQSAEKELKKHCIISDNNKSAFKDMFKYAKKKHAYEYSLQPNGLEKDVSAKQIAKEVERNVIEGGVQPEYVPLDIWRLVSPQLEGGRGNLTLVGRNYLPIRDLFGIDSFAVMTWKSAYNKWEIDLVDVSSGFVVKSSDRLFTMALVKQ